MEADARGIALKLLNWAARRRFKGYDPYDALDAMGDAVAHVHINDYDLKNRECKPPFFGELDLPLILSKLKKIGYEGDTIVEVYRENFEDISELTRSAKLLKDLITSINLQV